MPTTSFSGVLDRLTDLYRTIRNRKMSGQSRVTSSGIGQTLSPSKVAYLVYRPHSQLSFMHARVYISAQPIPRAKTYDDRATLAKRSHLLMVQQSFQGPSWGNSQCLMLTLYRGSIVSRLLHSPALVSVGTPQWLMLETFNCVALQTHLGLPSHAPNTATLVEA